MEKLLDYLKEQEKDGHKFGVCVPLVFKFSRDSEGNLFIDGESAEEKKFERYLCDFSRLGVCDLDRYGTIYRDKIPKKFLKITYPKKYLMLDEDYDPDFEDEYEEEDTVTPERVIYDIKFFMREEGASSFLMVLNYNLYPFRDSIYVITPDRDSDVNINDYDSDFLDRVVKTLGL